MLNEALRMDWGEVACGGEPFLGLSIPAPLSFLEQPLEVPQRKGRWAPWADSLRPRCQTDQQAGPRPTRSGNTQMKRRDVRVGAKEKKTSWEKEDTTVKKPDCTKKILRSGRRKLAQWTGEEKGRRRTTGRGKAAATIFHLEYYLQM